MCVPVTCAGVITIQKKLLLLYNRILYIEFVRSACRKCQATCWKLEMLFHVLCRLGTLGYMPKVAYVCSVGRVSGSAGALERAWPDLTNTKCGSFPIIIKWKWEVRVVHLVDTSWAYSQHKIHTPTLLCIFSPGKGQHYCRYTEKEQRQLTGDLQ